MNWAFFLSKIDWTTGSDADIDNLFEYLMEMSFKDRYDFIRDFEHVDKYNRPLPIDEIIISVFLFQRRRDKERKS